MHYWQFCISLYIHLKQKRLVFKILTFFSAQNKTRTCTPLRAPAPQAGMSTNFTIWALSIAIQNRKQSAFERECKTIKNLKTLIVFFKNNPSNRLTYLNRYVFFQFNSCEIYFEKQKYYSNFVLTFFSSQNIIIAV